LEVLDIHPRVSSMDPGLSKAALNGVCSTSNFRACTKHMGCLFELSMFLEC
jgi:hypothetical protein